MDVSAAEPNTDYQTDQYPLLLDRMERHASREHIVDISSNDEASTSSTPPQVGPGSTTVPTYQATPPTRSNGRNSARRADGYGRGRRRSPLNSGLWITVELIVTVSQVIASVVVLSLARDENPQAPLFAWVIGYASGCVAMLPILYWRFRNRNRSGGGQLDSAIRGSSSSTQQISSSNLPEARPYTAISDNQALDEESNQNSETTARSSHPTGFLSTRLNGLVDHLKMALDCFFAVWFVVGNVWIFGGHTSPSDAPKLYRLCIVFLTFSCIGYAMPFILCATICCCLPCIISVLGIREDFSQNRGATVDLINSLPTYKFKLKKSRDGSSNNNNNDNNQEFDSVVGEGGILAAGTEKEREISGEDAVCCICLARYGDNDELRELPCTHLFHVECVDKWLQINASCPLCKAELGESDSSSPMARGSAH